MPPPDIDRQGSLRGWKDGAERTLTYNRAERDDDRLSAMRFIALSFVDAKTPLYIFLHKGVFHIISLTMTYFHEGGPHYHRRVCVSRSCSGWEGVVPQSYGRQTLTVIQCI